jgi:hypothetical protein
MKPLLLLCCALACLPLRAQDVVPPPPVAIPGTETFTLHSQALATGYHIRVRLPGSYESTGKPYPVLYLLDGDHAFAMASDIVTYLEYGKHVPELIIVSPAYGSKLGPAEGGANQRQRDFSPFEWGGAPAEPRAEAYFAFLQDTLVPQIEARYRTQPGERALWGYSRSGLFVLWALFEKPGLFNRYIALDTAFRKFLELEEARAAQHRVLDASLFIGYGSLGNSKQDLEFMERLAARNYKRFRYSYQALQGQQHLMIPAGGLSLGLEFVYRK